MSSRAGQLTRRGCGLRTTSDRKRMLRAAASAPPPGGKRAPPALDRHCLPVAVASALWLGPRGPRPFGDIPGTGISAVRTYTTKPDSGRARAPASIGPFQRLWSNDADDLPDQDQEQATAGGTVVNPTESEANGFLKQLQEYYAKHAPGQKSAADLGPIAEHCVDQGGSSWVDATLEDK